MEVSFSPDIEAQLQQVAAHSGKSPQEFVHDTVSRTLKRRTQYLHAVEEGIAAADRGETVTHEEAVRQINQLLHS